MSRVISDSLSGEGVSTAILLRGVIATIDAITLKRADLIEP